jgi:hypothetical protein
VPVYGPAASALLNCHRSSNKAAVATMRGPFIVNSPCYVILQGIMSRLPTK